jgi:tetratricopeptide (TPR) repeat protein
VSSLFSSRPLSLLRIPVSVVALAAFSALTAPAQSSSRAQQQPPSSSSSSSSSSSDTPAQDRSGTSSSSPIPRNGPEVSGSGITLETSEPLFYVASALNACGYDESLAESAPVRIAIRQEINDVLAGSAPARDARDAICQYIRQHTLTDPTLNLAQYISLALYLLPPPDLTPSVDEPMLPPDSTQVVNILPLLRTFAETVHLNAIWFKHRADYDDLVTRVHDPLTHMVLGTDVYLHMPVNSDDSRRFLVLLEPMLSPAAVNARIYANDYIVVASPYGNPLGSVRMDQIRHTYLHYEIEPLIYSRATAAQRLQPLLKSVADAPLEFTYKSDIVALLTECLIKAVEARTMDVGIPQPERPSAARMRSDLEKYDADVAAYEKQAEAVRRKSVDLSVRQGWVLVDYFYGQIGQMERESISLKDYIGEMVYGMDVQREKHQADQVVFLPQGSGDFVRRGPRQLQGLDLAEMKLMKGDADGAEELTDAALKANPNDARANYIAGRIELIQGDPDSAIDHLNKTLTLTKDPRTLAWTHIYLGRLYDIARDPKNPEAPSPERPRAIAEYKAALTLRDAQPDTKEAAEKGLNQPFSLPRRAPVEEEGPIDPSGKAEKDSYKPSSPSQNLPGRITTPPSQ